MQLDEELIQSDMNWVWGLDVLISLEYRNSRCYLVDGFCCVCELFLYLPVCTIEVGRYPIHSPYYSLQVIDMLFRYIYLPLPPHYVLILSIVYLRCFGGEVANGAALAPKIGPLGLSAKKVGDDIAKNTKEFKGLRITVCLVIQNRQAKVEVVPSASSLIIQALAEPARDRKKEKDIIHDGDLGMEQIYEIARTMREKSMAKEFSGTVKEILGTCVSVGCTVDGKDCRDVQAEIDSGDLVCPEE